VPAPAVCVAKGTKNKRPSTIRGKALNFVDR